MISDAEMNGGVAFDIACDWLSFSIPVPIGGGGEFEHAQFVNFLIHHQFPEFGIEKMSNTHRRGVYKDAFRLSIGGLVLFSFLQPHALVEITGKGCRTLENRGEFAATAQHALEQCLNITRFDLAVDFETDLSPGHFTAEKGGRWKAGATDYSETGITEYVGAHKSERRAKVYRYYPPHERAHLLRCEMTYTKKGGAYDAVRDYLELPREEFAARMGNSFGWSHPVWCFESDEKIKNWRPETGSASTLRWLRKAVIPSLERLYAEGILDENHPLWAEIAEVLPLDYAPNEETPPGLTGGSKSLNPLSSTIPLPGIKP